MTYTIRPTTFADESFLWQMLFEAAHLAEEGASVQIAMRHPELSKYVNGWGRTGDMGFIALMPDHQPVGAVWLRLMIGNDRGFGWVNDQTPELAIAVSTAYRGKGIGSTLLQRVLQAANTVYPAVSLNVRAENPVVQLYERFGFEMIADSTIINRTGSRSFNMKRTFPLLKTPPL